MDRVMKYPVVNFPVMNFPVVKYPLGNAATPGKQFN
jgi:hypothetical protein